MHDMAGNFRHVINMANSIVGVSILSMPFCMKKVGLVLGVILILLAGFITRKTCMFLINSAIMARRRSIEFLAFHVFGMGGKLFVEMCMIFFLLGICISFNVVIGDLAPAFVSLHFNLQNTSALRTTLLIGMVLLVILPLCLLRNIDSLASMSALSLGFYIFLISVIFLHALPKLISGTWLQHADLCNFENALQILPIMCLALACQSNVFEIYDSIPDPDVYKMRFVVNHAVNLCCALYISVGFFGYVAFTEKDLEGNIIMSFPSSELTESIKLFFIISLAISYPLMLFPCRTAIHSLMYRRGAQSTFDLVGNYMPEGRFKVITGFILLLSLIVGIMVPNIEFVLGLLGSTMGTMISLILPSVFFAKLSSHVTLDKLFAQAVTVLGLIILVMGTYLNLSTVQQNKLIKNGILEEHNLRPPEVKDAYGINSDQLMNLDEKKEPVVEVHLSDQTRKEPVVPEPPLDGNKEMELSRDSVDKVINEPALPENSNRKLIGGDGVVQKAEVKQESPTEGIYRVVVDVPKDAVVGVDVGKNSEKEDIAASFNKKQAEFIEKMERQQKEQQAIIEEQKKILQELKDHKEEDKKKEEVMKSLQDVVEKKPVVSVADFVQSKANQTAAEAPQVLQAGILDKFLPVNNNARQVAPNYPVPDKDSDVNHIVAKDLNAGDIPAVLDKVAAQNGIQYKEGLPERERKEDPDPSLEKELRESDAEKSAQVIPDVQKADAISDKNLNDGNNVDVKQDKPVVNEETQVDNIPLNVKEDPHSHLSKVDVYDGVKHNDAQNVMSKPSGHTSHRVAKSLDNIPVNIERVQGHDEEK